MKHIVENRPYLTYWLLETILKSLWKHHDNLMSNNDFRMYLTSEKRINSFRDNKAKNIAPATLRLGRIYHSDITNYVESITEKKHYMQHIDDVELEFSNF